MQKLLKAAINPHLSKHVEDVTCGIEEFYGSDLNTLARYGYPERPHHVEDVEEPFKE